MLGRSHTVSVLNKAVGKNVTIVGWVYDIRLLGGINFILLRDSSGIVQVTVAKKQASQEILARLEGIHQEDIISVHGKVVKSAKTKSGVEVIPKKLEIVIRAEPSLPLDPRNVTKANLDTRLDWRSIDLRRPENSAIFKIQSKLIEGFETFLRKEGFIQVFTPSLLGGTSESGSDVFPVVYYDRQAFLRQDPQLHRELTIAGGFEKIFDVGPSWRAEKSHTVRHLSEHRTIATEIAFIKDETDVMRVEEEMVVFSLNLVKKECVDELKLLNKDVKIPKTPFPELKFPEIYNILKEMGKKIPFGEDYDTESEKLLGKYIKEKYKTDFFFVNRFPFSVKPFYVMRVDKEPEWARSIDLVFKGVEQSSGGQREHRYEKLLEQIKLKGMNLDNLKWFTEIFKFGVPPMGGFSLGFERFTKQLLDLENIRESTLFPRDTKRLLP